VNHLRGVFVSEQFEYRDPSVLVLPVDLVELDPECFEVVARNPCPNTYVENRGRIFSRVRPLYERPVGDQGYTCERTLGEQVFGIFSHKSLTKS